MKIFRSKRTRETCALLKEHMPPEFKDKPIVLNYGNSCNFNEAKYRGKIILNKKEAVMRCSHKKEMFKYIKNYAVDYADIKTPEGIMKAIRLLLDSKELVGRNKSKIGIITTVAQFAEIYDQIDYITVKERKLNEYRVLMVLGEPFRVMKKVNQNDDFALKIANSEFKPMKIKLFDQDAMENIKLAVKALGIDVCGVDILENDMHEFKILEVNSGAALCENSIRKFYKKLNRIIEKRYLLGGTPNGE